MIRVTQSNSNVSIRRNCVHTKYTYRVKIHIESNTHTLYTYIHIHTHLYCRLINLVGIGIIDILQVHLPWVKLFEIYICLIDVKNLFFYVRNGPKPNLPS